MTTNQTIDGVLVSRELLELALLELEDRWSWAGELRALLDAPASVESLVGRTGGGMVWHQCAVCHVKGSYHPDVKWCVCGRLFDAPSAQPQGEPVAEIVSKYGDPEAFGERELITLKDISKFPYGTKLYAERPAPVAVVKTCCGSCPGGCTIGNKP